MFIKVLRRCAPLLVVASLGTALFFLWSSGVVIVSAYDKRAASLGGSEVTTVKLTGVMIDNAVLVAPEMQAPYPPPGETPTDPPSAPPTATTVPPTATKVPPTATKVPPTATKVPPTATKVPPTATKVPPTTVPPTTVPPTTVPPTTVPLTTVPPTTVPPTTVPPTTVPPTPTPIVPPTATPPVTNIPTTYVVQRGDNLFRIARRFGVTVRALRFANNLGGTWIRVGQVLIIPDGGTPRSQPTPRPTESHPGDDHQGPVPTETHSTDDQHHSDSTGSSDAKPNTYTVKAGDNLFRIGLRFGVSVGALQAANGLRTVYIRVGQVLVIP